MKGKPTVILLVEDDEAHAILIIRSFEDIKLGNMQIRKKALALI